MNRLARKFDYRIIAPEPHVVTLLAEIDGFRGEFKYSVKANPYAITTLRKSVLITSAGASTRIEGGKLNDKEVEKIMQGLSVSRFADRDSQEVQGYLEVLQNVFYSYEDIPLRESTSTSLHNQLLKYSIKDDAHRGDYKKRENAVGILGKYGEILKVIFKTTPAYLAPKEMQELVAWTNTAFEKNRFHPLLIIANFIIEFLKIHPFEDGNGRLSRVLTNLLLLKFGYAFTEYVSHEQIIERRKDEYYFALRKSQGTFKTDEETIAPWLNFFLSVVREQSNKALLLLNEEKIEDTLSPKQFEVLNHLLTVAEASPSQIVNATHISLATVRQALNVLVKLGQAKRTGRGRGTRYRKL